MQRRMAGKGREVHPYSLITTGDDIRYYAYRKSLSFVNLKQLRVWQKKLGKATGGRRRDEVNGRELAGESCVTLLASPAAACQKTKTTHKKNSAVKTKNHRKQPPAHSRYYFFRRQSCYPSPVCSALPVPLPPLSAHWHSCDAPSPLQYP